MQTYFECLVSESSDLLVGPLPGVGVEVGEPLEDAVEVDGEGLARLVLAQLQTGLDHLQDLLLQHVRPRALLVTTPRKLLGVALKIREQM